jgi:hypothetical protein
MACIFEGHLAAFQRPANELMSDTWSWASFASLNDSYYYLHMA